MMSTTWVQVLVEAAQILGEQVKSFQDTISPWPSLPKQSGMDGKMYAHLPTKTGHTEGFIRNAFLLA